MKHKLLSLTLILTIASVAWSQTSVLIDFSKPGLESSAETDPNGYSWNNVVPDPAAPNGRLGWELFTEEERNAAPWASMGDYYNNYVTFPYPAIPDLVDQTGASTGAAFHMTGMEQRFVYDPPTTAGGFGRAGLEYGDDLGPLPTSTGWAPSATIDSFYVNYDYVITFEIVGLDDSKTYDLVFWGGQARDSRPAKFGVAGYEKVTIETLNNTGANAEDYATFTGVSPTGGVIEITYEQGADPGTFAQNGQWSVLEITGDFSGGGSSDWLGYAIDENGYADTGDWLGLVYVMDAPWVYIMDLAGWAYIMDDSGWVYVPDASAM